MSNLKNELRVVLMSMVAMSMALPAKNASGSTFGQWASNQSISSTTYVIDARNQGITSADGVENYHSVAILRLTNNPISNLTANQFASNTSLTGLDLGNIYISELSPEQFATNIKLTSLNLDNNQLSSLSPDQFAHNTALLSLSILNNQLTSLSPEQFATNTNLYSISIINNRISSLSPEQFKHNTALNIMSFYMNRISSLSPEQFSHNTALKSLVLSCNNISSLSADQFAHNTALTNLRLDYNQLSSLSPNQFKTNTALQHLTFNNNSITNLPDNMFSTNTALETLSFVENNMEILNLTGANFQSLKRFHFSSEIAVAGANFSNISNLTQAAWDQLFNKNTLYSGSFGQYAANVTFLNFANTSLSGLDMDSNTFLDILGNTCTSAALADFDTVTRLNLYGTGLTKDEIVAIVLGMDGMADETSKLYVSEDIEEAVRSELLANNYSTLVVGDIPEPATMSLLAVGCLALLRRKKGLRA